VQSAECKVYYFFLDPYFLFQSGGFLLTDYLDVACIKKKARNFALIICQFYKKSNQFL